jgi:hypothetical protein
MLKTGANGARFARMTSENDRLVDTIPAFRIDEHTSQVVRKIVKDDRRSISDVARALLERGVAAYDRDGKLFEPISRDDKEESPTVPAVQKNLGGRKGAKKQETA